jgi:MOSC domain-containing protein YiiM
MTTRGRVVAVCLSAEGGVPKHPQAEVNVGPHGIVGDFHAGETSRHGTSAGQPNKRQVSVVAEEAVTDAAAQLSIEIPHGGLGENVLVSGLGDLGELQPGQRLRFSSGVELQVTEQNNPCKNLMVWHPQVPKHLMGRRGVVCTVLTPGRLRAGDTVEIDG